MKPLGSLLSICWILQRKLTPPLRQKPVKIMRHYVKCFYQPCQLPLTRRSPHISEITSGCREIVTFDQLVNLADRHLQDLKGHNQVPVPEVIDISRVVAEARPQQKPWTDVVKRWRNTSSTTQPPPQPPVEKKSSRRRERSQKKNTGNRSPKFVRDKPRNKRDSSSSSGRSDDRKQNNRARQSSQRQPTQWCSFCDKTTHSKDTCYILNNKCSICKKSGHLSYKCSQRPTQQQQRKYPENCPVCNQPGHVGKNCPEWRNRRPRTK